jgi:hypothetical protein
MIGVDSKAKYITYNSTLIPGTTTTEITDETVTTEKGTMNPGV